MPLETVLEFVTRTDTKFGNVDAAVAAKLDPPIAGGTFDPTLIDLSLGQVQHPGYTQTAEIAFALDPSKTPVIGGSAAVNITGGGFAVTFSSPFVGLDGMTSGAVLETDVDYTFVFLHAENWIEVAPGVFEDRVLIVPSGIKIATARLADGALGPVPDDAGFDPTAIDLSGNSAPAHTQVGATQLALDGGVTAVNGATCWIAWTGDASAITCDGTTVKWSDGTAGAKTLDGLGTLVVSQHPALAYAVAYLEGEAAAGGGTWGSITGTLADQDDLQAALDAKAPTANPVFTGTVTIPDGALAIADTSGLQTALDAKAPSSSPTLSNPTLTGTVTVPDGALAIADTSGLQTALDAKAPTARQVATQHSLTGGGDLSADRTLNLVGDAASPGPSQYYGTDASSTRGYFDLPEGGAVAAPDVSYTPFWSGAIALDLKTALDSGIALGKYFGLNGNGIFDNTTVLHTALDAILAAGGGDLVVAPGGYNISNITLRNKVQIVGQNDRASPAAGVRFDAIAGTTGVLFTGPTGSPEGYGLRGLFIGGGSSLTLGTFLTAVQFSAGLGTIAGCYISNFTSHCIRFSGGFQTAEDVVCNNGFYNAYEAVPDIPAVKSGLVHLEGGSDHTIRYCGVSARASGKVTSADLRVCAVVVKSNGCWLIGGDYHHCDVGMHIGDGAFRTQIHGIRIDACAGHGIEIPSSTADHTMCVGVTVQRVGGIIIVSPAYDSTNLYDGLSIQDPSNHTFVGCRFHGRMDGGVTPQMRYGINDTSGSNSSNAYIGCPVNNAVTAAFNVPASAHVISEGVINQVEKTVTGTYTLTPADFGKSLRFTGTTSSWTVNNIGVGEIYVEHAGGSGTLTFQAGTSTARPGSAPSIGFGAAARIHFSNGGANYRVSTA